MAQGIGAVFGGLAEGIKAGYGLRLAGQELGLKQQQIGIAQQSADTEAEKLGLQVRQFQSLQDSANNLNVAMMGPLKNEQAVAGALDDLSTLRDLSTVDPVARKALVAPWVQSWANKAGVQVSAPVIDTLSRTPSETLTPVIDQITAGVNSGEMGPQEVAAALADPAAFAQHFAGYAAAAKANTPTDGSIGPDNFAAVTSESAMQFGAMKRRLATLDAQIAGVERASVTDPNFAKVKQSQLAALYRSRDVLTQQMTALSTPKTASADATVFSPATGATAHVQAKSDVLSPAAEAQQVRINATKAGGAETARIDAQTAAANKMVFADPNNPALPEDTREQALAKLKPGMAAKFQAWYDGRAPIPNAGRNNIPLQTQIDTFNQIYPDADSSKLAQRQKMINEYSSQRVGQPGAQVNSVNVLAQHMNEWRQALAALGNGSSPDVNALSIWARKHWGDGAPTAADAIISRLSEEMVRFYRGAGGAEGDIVRNLEEMKKSFSPDQQAAMYNSMAALLFDKLRPLKGAWDQTMGDVSTAVKVPEFLTPAAEKAFIAGGVDPQVLQEFKGAPAGTTSVGAPPAGRTAPAAPSAQGNNTTKVKVRLADGRVGTVNASDVGAVIKAGGQRLQ